MSIKSMILSFAADNKVTLTEAANAVHDEIDNFVETYKRESAVFAAACDKVIAENPSVSKESLAPMVAMALSANNPAAFPSTLKSVSEFVDLTYVGKRGRRAADDNSVRLTKRG